jgi:hypothetical protein
MRGDSGEVKATAQVTSARKVSSGQICDAELRTGTQPQTEEFSVRDTSTHHCMQLVEFSVDMLLPEQVRQSLSLESGLAYRPAGQRTQASRPGKPIQPALQGVHWEDPTGLAVRLPQNPHNVDAFAAVA